MNLFPSYHTHNHFHIHVNTPEDAVMVAKVWNPKDQETNVKEQNEQNTTENTDKKPIKKE